MIVKKILLATLAALTLNTPLIAKEIKQESVPVVLGQIYTEDKQSIMVSADHPEFTLKLKSNPTTGYSWFLRDYDPDMMTPIKHSFEGTTPKLMGSPSYELWTFKVKPTAFVVPQETVIRMVYTRPWETNDGSTQIVFRVMTQGK